MLIEVFGPGCAKCETLLKHARHAVELAGIEAQVVKVSDYLTMAQRGVLSTPALAVNGQLKSQGKVLSSTEILEWLKG
ncbi:MAG: thioredoxin family protein [Firmicutes bacterium]|nr:thioredoxin family protein [Bacillota bacterium]